MTNATANAKNHLRIFATKKAATEREFLHFYNSHSEALFRYCYFRVFDGEKAKDYVQEAFCKTWKYLAKGNTIENIPAFLYRTARNIMIDEYRKKKMLSLDYLMEKGFSPNIDSREKLEKHFTSLGILQTIQLLDSKYRNVMLMKYVKDLSTKEIALTLHETENNVYVRLSRGLCKVRKIIKNEEAKIRVAA